MINSLSNDIFKVNVVQIKCTVLQSHPCEVLDLHNHFPVTHGPPRATSSPASPTHGKCPVQVYHILPIFTVSFYI
jgi:hypothetical protein